MTSVVEGLQGAEVVERALRPRKLAVIGASANPSKIGYIVCRDLLVSGFDGDLVFVNPNGGEVHGHPITADVSQAAGADLALIATPAHTVHDIVTTCGELAIPLAIVV